MGCWSESHKPVVVCVLENVAKRVRPLLNLVSEVLGNLSPGNAEIEGSNLGVASHRHGKDGARVGIEGVDDDRDTGSSANWSVSGSMNP